MTTDPPLLPDGALVVGAGWLGAALAEHWAARGVRVTTVRRRAHAPPDGGTAVALDVRTLDTASDDDAPLPVGLGQHDVVVALVAPDRGRGDDHAGTYPAAARGVVRLAHAVGARALCWISSTGVYGYRDGREVTETTPTAADDPSQRALLDAEAAVLAAASPTRRVAVLRVAGLYGPGRDPAPRYRDPAALVGRLDQWINLAWRDDVIAAIHCWTSHALRERAAPTFAAGDDRLAMILNVADGTPLTVREVASLVARADGRTLVLPAGGVAGAPSSAPPSRSNQRIRVDALRALGWRPGVPTLRDGLLRLGYGRLASDHPPYGPHTADVRTFLRRIAELDTAAHAEAVARWASHGEQPAFRRAERLLGEVMARSGREAERDAAAGPLLRLVRAPSDAGAAEPSATATGDASAAFDPIAEPALAALMAIVVRDLLPADVFATLVAPLAALVPAAAVPDTAVPDTAVPEVPVRDAPVS